MFVLVIRLITHIEVSHYEREDEYIFWWNYSVLWTQDDAKYTPGISDYKEELCIFVSQKNSWDCWIFLRYEIICS